MVLFDANHPYPKVYLDFGYQKYIRLPYKEFWLRYMVKAYYNTYMACFLDAILVMTHLLQVFGYFFEKTIQARNARYE